METQRYMRKPVLVEAVRVTDENIVEVAKWLGAVIEFEPGERQRAYIVLNVKHPMYPRQKQAFVGDWVLKNDNGVKGFSDKAFLKSFDRIEFDAIPE